MITFNDFIFNKATPLNEGLFDKLTSMFVKIAAMFKDPMKIKKSVDAAVTEAGIKGANFIPKNVKVNETYILSMGDGKNPINDFSIALTKLAELPDKSNLFQISATTSQEMIKSLTGSPDLNDLARNNIMAIISSNGFERGKPTTMRIVKNILPNGKDYTTKSLLLGAVPSTAVQTLLLKQKTI
jgi:hypothetical protein